MFSGEKTPLKIPAEIIKLFNFTVNLSERGINPASYCLPRTRDFSAHWLAQTAWECLSNVAQRALCKHRHFTEVLDGRAARGPGRGRIMLPEAKAGEPRLLHRSRHLAVGYLRSSWLFVTTPSVLRISRNISSLQRMCCPRGAG